MYQCNVLGCYLVVKCALESHLHLKPIYTCIISLFFCIVLKLKVHNTTRHRRIISTRYKCIRPPKPHHINRTKSLIMSQRMWTTLNLAPLKKCIKRHKLMWLPSFFCIKLDVKNITERYGKSTHTSKCMLVHIIFKRKPCCLMHSVDNPDIILALKAHEATTLLFHNTGYNTDSIHHLHRISHNAIWTTLRHTQTSPFLFLSRMHQNTPIVSSINLMPYTNHTFLVKKSECSLTVLTTPSSSNLLTPILLLALTAGAVSVVFSSSLSNTHTYRVHNHNQINELNKANISS